MARIKVVKSSMPPGLEGMGNINDIFKGDPETCNRNYSVVVENLDMVCKALELVSKSFGIVPQVNALVRYYNASKITMPTVTDIMDEAIPEGFVDNYKKFKASQFVVSSIRTLTHLEEYREYVIKKNIMLPIASSGLPFHIFDEFLPSFDLSKVPEKSHELVNQMITMIYGHLRIAYDQGIRQKDVDTKILTTILTQSILNMKKTMPRHAKTFALIEKHTNLLSETIDEKYIDYEASEGNVAVILEDYFKKIKEASDDDLSVTTGLRDIISEMKKRIASDPRHASNPKIKMAMQALSDINF